MSLDVFLELPEPIKKPKGSGIFIRMEGQTVEISLEEWKLAHFGENPMPMPCTVEQEEEATTAYTSGITHNLSQMAKEAEIYEYLWRPEELGIKSAKELITPLSLGLQRLKKDPDRFMKFNPENGWGSYETLVRFVENYLEACIEYPEAAVWVSR